MVVLDQLENDAFHHLMRLLQEADVSPPVTADASRLSRAKDGRIVVPIEVEAVEPSIPLALLATHKAEQVYKQTGCRFVIAQRPVRDPQQRTYVWGDNRWEMVP